MDQRPDNIRQDVDSIRDSMTDKMMQLEDRIKGTVEDTTTAVKQTLDVKYQVGQRPWSALGVAMLAGYALGTMGDSGPRYDQHRDYRREGERPTSPTSATSQEPGIVDQLMSQFSGEIELVKAAAMASVVDMVRGVIRQNLPGLSEEHTRISAQRTAQQPATGTAPVPKPVTPPEVMTKPVTAGTRYIEKVMS